MPSYYPDQFIVNRTRHYSATVATGNLIEYIQLVIVPRNSQNKQAEVVGQKNQLFLVFGIV